MSLDLTIFVDGACSGNPGAAGIGVIVYDGEQQVLKEISEPIGEATNNIAEYRAIIKAIETAHELNANTVKIYTDSQLVYSQVTGKYKVKNQNMKALYDQVVGLVKGFEKISIEHVLRDKNKEADRLATKSISKKQDKVVASLFDNDGEESPSSKG